MAGADPMATPMIADRAGNGYQRQHQHAEADILEAVPHLMVQQSLPRLPVYKKDRTHFKPTPVLAHLKIQTAAPFFRASAGQDENQRRDQADRRQRQSPRQRKRPEQPGIHLPI